MTSIAVEHRERRNPLAAVWGFVKRHVLAAYSVLFFAYLLLPIAVVIVFSFNNPPGKFNYTWNSFTWDNWRYWNGVPGIESAVVLSLEIALIASLIAGFLWEAFGASSTFLAGAGFSAVTLAGLVALGLARRRARQS